MCLKETEFYGTMKGYTKKLRDIVKAKKRAKKRAQADRKALTKQKILDKAKRKRRRAERTWKKEVKAALAAGLPPPAKKFVQELTLPQRHSPAQPKDTGAGKKQQPPPPPNQPTAFTFTSFLGMQPSQHNAAAPLQTASVPRVPPLKPLAQTAAPQRQPASQIARNSASPKPVAQGKGGQGSSRSASPSVSPSTSPAASEDKMSK